MATTTNYSWTTPDDTDLVKDGAAAIRSLGTAIDTTVFNNAGAAIAKSLIDAEGDLIVGDADNAVQRLAIGSNGNVLTVDTTVDGKIKWAAPAGGGKVLQVVSATTTTTTSITSATFTDSTITATITPSSATSKVLVLASSIQYLSRASGANEIAQVSRLMRGATEILLQDLAQMYGGENVNQKSLGAMSSWVYLDSPATTSATTYKIQGKTDGSTSVVFQGGTNDTSVITLLEIGA
jgi:hypothetical protein